MKKVYCDKSKNKPVFIPKKNELKYLNIKREFQVKVITDSVLNNIGLKQIDIVSKKQIKNVIDSLNQTNVFYNQIINAYYLGLLSDYCNAETVRRYFDAIDGIKNDMKELEKLKSQVVKLITSNGIGGSNVTDILSAFDTYFKSRN